MQSILSLFSPTILILALALPTTASDRAQTIRLQGATQAEAPKRISVDQIEELPQVEKTLFDPYLKRTVRYGGVDLKAFTARFASPEAQGARVSAIDEYVVNFSRSDLESSDYILATRMDGLRMNRSMSGPVKIVRQTDDPENRYVQKWIWMINRIEFLTE